MIKLKVISLSLGFSLVGLSVVSFAQTPTETDRFERTIDQQRKLEKRLLTQPSPAVIEPPQSGQPLLPKSDQKVLIKKIKVFKVTYFKPEQISRLIEPYKNQQLNLQQMQELAEKITAFYRDNGYITSRAYLPPQKIATGLLKINVVESVVGDITIKKNRYFNDTIIKKKISLTKGDPFDVNILKASLRQINLLPDLKAKVILAAGKTPQSTDIVLEIEDSFPVHLGWEWNNYGSRYIYRDRYSGIVSFTNFSQHADTLSLGYFKAQSQTYWLENVGYNLPLSKKLALNFVGYRSTSKLGREYRDLNVRGKTQIYNLGLTQKIIDQEKISIKANYNFDYKNIYNFQEGQETSHDRLRILKLSLDLDRSDQYGRWIALATTSLGIPNIMGGSPKKDLKSSRAGAGGKFTKQEFVVMRLHQLPFNSILLWKNNFQLTNNILCSEEQFQIGGASTVRGYPAAEKTADKGFVINLDWLFPFYGCPKNIKIPFSKGLVYDCLRFDLFYDFGSTAFNQPQTGVKKTATLRSAGWGLRLNLPENFNVRLDMGWPLGGTSSDDKHVYTWIQITKDF